MNDQGERGQGRVRGLNRQRPFAWCFRALTAIFVAVTVSAAVPDIAAAATRVLRNETLELALDVREGVPGAVRVVGIRDLVANRQWLSAPSPLFELSAYEQVWSSDGGLVVESLSTSGNTSLVIGARTRDRRFVLEIRVGMESGSGPAVVSGSVMNDGVDWFGPFHVGDRDHGPIAVFPREAEMAAVRRHAAHEEVLVCGFDGILYATEEREDGPWSAPRPLYSTSDPALRHLFPAGASIAAVRRNGHQRDAFAIARDGHLYTVFRLDDGEWSRPLRLSHAALDPFSAGASVVALSVHEQTDPASPGEPRENELAVFAISKGTGQVLVSREINDGRWSEPAPINPAHPPLGSLTRLAAVKRNQRQQDLFAVDPEGRLVTTFHHQGAALWSDLIQLSEASGRLKPGSRLAAVRGRGDDVHVFVVGQAFDEPSGWGSLYETHEVDDGAWSALAPIAGPLTSIEPGAAITAVRRTGAEIDVMVVQRDGSIGLMTRDASGTWSALTTLPASRRVSASGTIASILRRPGQLDLFGIDRTNGRIWTSADGRGSVFLRTVFPKIRFTGNSTLEGLVGMVPQEIGTVTKLKSLGADWNKLGMPYEKDPTAQKVGLPEAMNALEVVNVARDGRSLFFADLGGHVESGRAPIQFTLAPDEVAGFWVARLKARQVTPLPRFAIGVGDRDWRRAVDFYVARHSSQSTPPAIPAWLREAGAIYTFSGGGAGGIYLDSPGQGTCLKGGAPAGACQGPGYADLADPQTCPHDQGTFRCALRRMLNEARDLGTDVIYLVDYWEAKASPIVTCPDVLHGSTAPYFCKGDYFIRADMGGVGDLRAAIDEVHRPRPDGPAGRVILYVEPFVVHKNSAVGNAFGGLWGGRFPGEGVWTPFGDDDPSIAMSQANGEWQQRLVETARSLIEQTHADGIFLDSGGWRLNLPTETKQEVLLDSPLENAMAVLNLVDRVRTEIRTVDGHADAVVLTETTSGPMWRHVDGGLSADFNRSSPTFTGRDTLNGPLLFSPIRYGVPGANFFSNGTNLNELNQVFAAGHGLALCSNWGDSFMRVHAPYIQKLVQARRRLASALVHGRPVFQIDLVAPNDGFAVASSYAGSPPVVTILNPSASVFSGTVPAHALMQPGSEWRDWLTGDAFTVGPAGVPITVPSVPAAGGCTASSACGLRILVRTN